MVYVYLGGVRLKNEQLTEERKRTTDFSCFETSSIPKLNLARATDISSLAPSLVEIPFVVLFV